MMKKLSVTMTHAESYIGWSYMVLQLFVLPNLLLTVNDLLPTPLPNAVLNLLFFGMNFVSVLLIFHRFLRRSLAKALEQPIRNILVAIAGVFLNYLGSFLVGIFIFRICPNFSNVNDDAISVMTREYRLVMSMGAILLVPLAEETLFRGLIFRPLYNRFHWIGYLLSALVFSSVHVVGYIGKTDWLTLLLCLLQYIPPSLFLGWAYEETDTICTPIIMHIIINAIGISAMR